MLWKSEYKYWKKKKMGLSNVHSVQGGVMSPILFNIYIDELFIKLRVAAFGCHIGHIFCGALGYADDVILLAPTLYSLRSMLQICENFSEEYDVLFNTDNLIILNCCTLISERICQKNHPLHLWKIL
jgi:hypothetical protein